MSKITKFAKGKPCTIRLPDICCFDTETSVMSHVPKGLRFGKGMRIKPSDLLVAISCYKCHLACDAPATYHLDADYAELCWWRGHGETLLLLWEEGII